jgi:hypothetical protein
MEAPCLYASAFTSVVSRVLVRGAGYPDKRCRVYSIVEERGAIALCPPRGVCVCAIQFLVDQMQRLQFGLSSGGTAVGWFKVWPNDKGTRKQASRQLRATCVRNFIPSVAGIRKDL